MAGHGLEFAELILKTPALQDDIRGSSTYSTLKGRLVSIPRSAGHVLACAHPPHSPTKEGVAYGIAVVIRFLADMVFRV